MLKTKEEVLEFVKTHKIRNIQLWFTDILETLKCCFITSDELPAALNYGKGFDGSSIAGFAEAKESNILAKPDPSTFQLIPWEDREEPVGRMLCDILTLKVKQNSIAISKNCLLGKGGCDGQYAF